MKLKTLPYLDLSTAHISQCDMELLDEHSLLGNNRLWFTVSTYPEGAFVAVGDDEGILEQLKEKGFSSEFIEIYRQCQKQSIYLIRLDSAGDMHDLPTFDW